MAIVNGNYLTEIIGNVTEMDLKGFVVYSEKLGKNLILPIDVFNALDEEATYVGKHHEVLKTMFEDIVKGGKDEREVKDLNKDVASI